MKKDLVSKEIIKEILKDIAKYFLNLEIGDNITFLDKELKRIEKREADIVANINDEFILHLEIQNSNDKNMPIRMARYYLDILSVTSLPIKQYVIYIGKQKPNFKTELNRDLILYKYNFIDVKTIDCDLLLKQNSPDALVLAILCDFKDKNPKDVIQYIINNLKKHTEGNDYKKYVLMLETLSSNRDLETTVKEVEMLRTTTYQDLPSWQIGMEMGIAEGIEKGIEQGMEQGLQKGLQKGLQEGIQNGKILAMYELGLDIDTIAQKMNKTKEEILQIIKEYNG